MRLWTRRGWGGSSRWFVLVVLAIGSLAASRAVFATSHAQSPTATPVPTLTPIQVRADQTVRTFFAYYDRRDISGILGLLATHFRYFDCDYRRHVMVFFDTKPALRRWLLARFRDHDYFGPLGPLGAGPGSGNVPVGPVEPLIRLSDALVSLSSKGLTPFAGEDSPVFKFIVAPNGRILGAPVSTDCSAGQRLPGTKPKKETALAKAFLTAYNHHDVAGVIRLLSPRVLYGDCGLGTGGQVAGMSQVRACLRSLFAEGDTFAKPKIILNGYLVQSGPPYTIMIQALRSNTQLLAQGDAPQVITLDLETNASVTRIRRLGEWLPPTQ